MPANAVTGFMPSIYGFRFRNSWDPNTINLHLGPIGIPIGNADRGLCGGMIFAARDRFERSEPAPLLGVPPSPSEAMFQEIVDRQLASFSLLSVPMRFWLAAIASQTNRDKATALEAWPAIKAEIDGGHLAMVGLVRMSTWNPFARRLGHQVLAYRYDETAAKVSVWVYDPNEPGNDDVELSFERDANGTITYGYRPQQPLVGLLALPYEPPRS